MKIALCTPSLSRAGGSNTGMNELYLQLVELGHDVSRWSLGQTNDGDVFAVTRKTQKETGRQTMEMGKDIISWPELHDRHDVVHITNAGQVYMGFDELLDKNVGPTVLSFHDPYELLVDQVEGRMFRLLGIVDRVHFIGMNFYYHFLKAGYLIAEDALSKTFWTRQPYTRKAASMPNVPDRPDAVICTSNWRWNKGIPFIVDAAEQLAEFGMHVEFWTTDRMDDVYEQVRYRKGFENCEIHGDDTFPEDFQREAYTGARVHVNMVYFDDNDTGRTEYPILEAWDYGLMPVVNQRFVGREPTDYTILEDVIPAPANGGDIADACVLARRMVHNDFSKRLEEHDTAHVGAEIVKVYEEIA